MTNPTPSPCSFYSAGQILLAMRLHMRFTVERGNPPDVQFSSFARLDNLVAVLLAGEVVVRMHNPKGASDIIVNYRSRRDFDEANELVRAIHGDWSESEVDAFLVARRHVVERLLRGQGDLMFAIAEGVAGKIGK